MNSKYAYIFRIVLAAYLAFLGGRLLYVMIEQRPANMGAMSFIAVVYMILGVAYAIYSGRKLWKILKKPCHLQRKVKLFRKRKVPLKKHRKPSRQRVKNLRRKPKMNMLRYPLIPMIWKHPAAPASLNSRRKVLSSRSIWQVLAVMMLPKRVSGIS